MTSDGKIVESSVKGIGMNGWDCGTGGGIKGST